MRATRLTVLASLVVALAACGGGGGSDSDAPPDPVQAPPAPAPSPTPAPGAAPAAGPTITIEGMAFEPLILQVAPGDVVTVRSLDLGMAHSVTSQSAPGTFTRGAVAGVSFDTGAFVGTRTFTIPASAPVGTTVPFYCSTHLSTMVTPNGELRIVSAPATVTNPPPDSGTPLDPGAPY